MYFSITCYELGIAGMVCPVKIRGISIDVIERNECNLSIACKPRAARLLSTTTTSSTGRLSSDATEDYQLHSNRAEYLEPGKARLQCCIEGHENTITTTSVRTPSIPFHPHKREGTV